MWVRARAFRPKLAPYSVLGFFGSLGMAIKAMDPTADRRHLTKITTRLGRTVKSVRNISANLLRPTELVALGRAMMDEAELQGRFSRRAASLYRDGALTMFMAYCPLRPAWSVS